MTQPEGQFTAAMARSVRSATVRPGQFPGQMPQAQPFLGTATPGAPVPSVPTGDTRQARANTNVPLTKAQEQELNEERSQWLTQVMMAHPEYLAMRERSLPVSGGYSFSNVTHTLTVSSLSSVNRHAILELIFQHLEAIGMYRTAEILAKESGHLFQTSGQPWDRTDLHLLSSLAVGHREDIWNLRPDQDHIYANEFLEEDFFASPYREDPTTIEQEFYNPQLNVVYENSSGRKLCDIKCCSLKRFVVYFAVETPSPDEVQLFVLSMHAITSASHFLEHLVTLYDMRIDRARSPYSEETNRKVKSNILKFIKQWMSYRVGNRAVKLIRDFLLRLQREEPDDTIKREVPAMLKALGMFSENLMIQPPPVDGLDPVIPDPHILFTMSLGLLDPEPVELARQITLCFHEKFAAIHTLELMTAISKKKTTIQTPTLAEFFSFGDNIMQLLMEAFLNAQDKEKAFTRILELAQALSDLSNIDALSCVVRVLQRPDIQRLGGTAPERSKPQLQQLLDKTGEGESLTTYVQFITDQYSSEKPTIPNMNVELLRGDSQADKEPNYINGLINWGKLKKLGKRCVVFNRFQTQRYKLIPIPQIRKIITASPELSYKACEEQLDEQYRLRAKSAALLSKT